MKITYEALADKVEARLQLMQLYGQDQSAALRALGRVLVNRVRFGFVSQRDPWGGRWKPLSPIYRVGQPLRNTGQLMNSLSSRVQGESVIVGTNLKAKGGVLFPAVLQYGATIKPVKAKVLAFRTPVSGGKFIFLKKAVIPARPFLPLKDGKIELPDSWAKSALLSMAKSMGFEATP